MTYTVEGGGPAQCKILDSLHPREPKGKNPMGFTFFFAHQEKTKVQFHPLNTKLYCMHPVNNSMP